MPASYLPDHEIFKAGGISTETFDLAMLRRDGVNSSGERSGKFKEIVRREFVNVERRRFKKNDPIRWLANGLGIDRFITTNYDLEIEFEALRHEFDAADDKQRRKTVFAELQKRRDDASLREAVTREYSDYCIRWPLSDGFDVVSDCFDRERIDRLYEFSARSADYRTHIFHLHGRATDPETMVLSYSDYESQYRKSGIAKLPFEDGLRTLFAANPVLFVGLGMTEDDFLRYHKQFVSDHRVSDIAPQFVLWNSHTDKDGKVTLGGAKQPNHISNENRVLRLRLYRTLGVHTIFDTELPGFPIGFCGVGKTQLAEALGHLASTASKYRRPFEWKHNYFRTMKGFLPNPRDPSDDRWSNGTIVWPSKDGNPSRSTGKSSSQLYDVDYVERGLNFSKFPRRHGKLIWNKSTNPKDYLAHILTLEPSNISAFIGPPGSGHGTLSRMLRDFVLGKVRSALKSGATSKSETVFFQVNAGFAWEIDTTFSIVSGLFDSRLAFDEGQSRFASFRQYLRDLESVIDHGHRDNFSGYRRIFICINIADRFFDSSGYCLSSELDIMLRSQVSNTFGSKLSNFVKGTSRVKPTNFLIFGTARVERYLRAIVHEQGEGQSSVGVNWFHVGYPPSKPEQAHYLWPLTILDDRSAVHKNLTESRYLNSLYSAFIAAASNRLGLARDFPKIRNALTGKMGEQRRAFFSRFLNGAVLSKVMPPRFVSMTDFRCSSLDRAKQALIVLKTMAFLGQPVEVQTIAAVGQIRQSFFKDGIILDDEELNKKLIAEVEELLVEMLKLKLVIEIEQFPDIPADWRRFGLHRAMLDEIRERHAVPMTDASTHASFNVPLYAAQLVDDVEPKEEVQKQLGEIIDDLLNLGSSNPTDLDYGMRLRAAAASMRSYNNSATLLMHEPHWQDGQEPNPRLGEYARRLARLIAAAEETAPALSAGEHQFFFPDDLVWMHDQRGVALLAQGDLYEARRAFTQGGNISKSFVEFGDHTHNWRRIELNQLHLDIERGKITSAEARARELESSIDVQMAGLGWLPETQDDPLRGKSPTPFSEILRKYGRTPLERTRIVDPHFPADFILATALVTGYRGWCDYVRGKLRAAEKNFEQAVQILRNIGEQRAYAVFMRLYAALLGAMDQNDKAMETINLCLAAADSVRQMDIAYLARINKGDMILRADQSKSEPHVLQQLLHALRYASHTDMFRVKLEARKSLAKIRFDGGDFDGALEQASDALGIAIRFGFTLRKITLRIQIGQILIRRGDPISGNEMLDQAIKAADRIGYQRAVELAHKVRTNGNMRAVG